MKFNNSYSKLPEHFYARQLPESVPNPELLKLNEPLAVTLGIDIDWLKSEQGISMLAGNYLPQGAEPIAQAYAGHQFGGFVPQLGDGRAILLGEIINKDGLRQDIQLKGSGRTVFSRGGDGKAVIGPVIREYIVSEAMAAMGVPSTRALAAVTTGERIVRQDEVLPGAILTRVASSHLRIGTFQYFAAQRDTKAVRKLADYAINRHYPECLDIADLSARYLEFLKLVLFAQAELIAQWMSLGFIHGVMNTDNMTISGETIDYGPCAFIDAFHPQCVFSSIDVNARYSWGNQPNIGYWNLTRLAETLIPLFDDDQKQAIEKAESVLSHFEEYFSIQYLRRFRAKFGLSGKEPDSIITDGLSLLANHKVDFTVFFRKLTQVAEGEDAKILLSMFTDNEPFKLWLKQWHKEVNDSSSVDAMRASNPIRIPRNHRIEQAIQNANQGDYDLFYRLLDALADPYVESTKYAEYEKPPKPDEMVYQTFCGT